VHVIAGALEENEYQESWRGRDSRSIEVEPTRCLIRLKEARDFLASAGLDRRYGRSANRWKFITLFVAL